MKQLQDTKKNKREATLPRGMNRSKGASSTGTLPKLTDKSESPDMEKRGNSHKENRKGADWKKFKNPLAPIAKSHHIYASASNIEQLKSQDYLRGLRLKRQEEERQGIKRKMIDDKTWERFLHDEGMSDFQRLEQIKMRARQMEQRAEMDEKLLRNSGAVQQDVEKTIALNDMYLEAIQTKLKLLD